MEKDPGFGAGSQESRSPEQDNLSQFQRVGKFASRVGGVIHPRLGIAAGYMFGLSREQMGIDPEEKDKGEKSEKKHSAWGRFRQGFERLFGAHMVEDPRTDRAHRSSNESEQVRHDTTAEPQDRAMREQSPADDAAEAAQTPLANADVPTHERPTSTHADTPTAGPAEAATEASKTVAAAHAESLTDDPVESSAADKTTADAMDSKDPKDRESIPIAEEDELVTPPIREPRATRDSLRHARHRTATYGGNFAQHYMAMSQAERDAFDYGQRSEYFYHRRKERTLATAAVLGGAAFLYERHRRKKEVGKLTRQNKKLAQKVAAVQSRLAQPEPTPTAASIPNATRSTESPQPQPASLKERAQPVRRADLVMPVPFARADAKPAAMRPTEQLHDVPITAQVVERDQKPVPAVEFKSVPEKPDHPDLRFADKLPLLIPILPPEPSYERAIKALSIDQPEINKNVEPAPQPRQYETPVIPDLQPRQDMVFADVAALLERSGGAALISKNSAITGEIPRIQPDLIQNRRKYLELIERAQADPQEIARLLHTPEAKQLLTHEELLKIEQLLVKNRSVKHRGAGLAVSVAGSATRVSQSTSQKQSNNAASSNSSISPRDAPKKTAQPWPAALVFGLILAALVYAWLSQ